MGIRRRYLFRWPLRSPMVASREQHGFPHWVIYEEAHLLGTDEQAHRARRDSYVLSSFAPASLPTHEIDDLHGVVQDIRTGIFHLHCESAGITRLRQRFDEAIAQLSADLPTTVQYSGPLSVVDAALAEHAEAVVKGSDQQRGTARRGQQPHRHHRRRRPAMCRRHRQRQRHSR
jgi:hypothetical protein